MQFILIAVVFVVVLAWQVTSQLRGHGLGSLFPRDLATLASPQGTNGSNF